MNLLIAGAGGHGKVVADAADAMNAWRRITFLDDRFPATATVCDWQVAGTLGQLEAMAGSHDAFVAAFGDGALRLQTLERAARAGMTLATVIHPKAIVSPRARIGNGSVVFAGAVVNAGAQLGAGCIVNTGATVDHDCDLGDGVHVCPGVNIAGGVRIGAGSWIGIGSAIIQCITIGEGATVGAGAVVIRAVGAGETVIGNPARVLRHA